ncbi:MAG: hypothetical protein C0605_05760 [Hyphomicrobiales bacterium]|nr:MAG: hypothetical protein C0605_05760 [Hyphomicrobiales bacterium]
MKGIGDIASQKKFRLRPRYTTIHWPIVEKFNLTSHDYAVFDSIHKLSHRPEHPWCTESKDRIGEWIKCSRRTVFNAIDKGLELGLIEKNDRGDLRSTEKWIQQVELYSTDENID